MKRNGRRLLYSLIESNTKWLHDVQINPKTCSAFNVNIFFFSINISVTPICAGIPCDAHKSKNLSFIVAISLWKDVVWEEFLMHFYLFFILSLIVWTLHQSQWQLQLSLRTIQHGKPKGPLRTHCWSAAFLLYNLFTQILTESSQTFKQLRWGTEQILAAISSCRISDVI